MSESIFRITASDHRTDARSGVLRLSHGYVKTPVFMPVGTNGTVKAIAHHTLEEMGFDLILGNTYHLYLRPGLDIITEFGGLHEFSSWERNILTDSGGYQVFSLAPFRKIGDAGVSFRSHIDGSYHELTPEKVIDIQIGFGSDVLMPLDVCTPSGIEYAEALHALELTTTWAQRSIDEWVRHGAGGALFGIVQGNCFKDLRERSAVELTALDFTGYAIGGLSVGEPFDVFQDILSFSAPLLPRILPRYLMGIGTPEYILSAVENGVDMFDCVFPTRIARNGTVFTRNGTIALKRECYSAYPGPIDDTCKCPVCLRYSCGYLRHLFKAREILGPMLATWHNIFFLKNFVDEIRDSINNGCFSEYKREFLLHYEGKHAQDR